MPRTAHGFLKPEALISGVPDQFAIVIDGIRHEVSIVHDRRRGGYVTAHKRIPLRGIIEVSEWQVGTDLHTARAIFRRTARALGGRV